MLLQFQQHSWTLVYVFVCMCMLLYVLIWECVHDLSFIVLILRENVVFVEDAERPTNISPSLVSTQHTHTPLLLGR